MAIQKESTDLNSDLAWLLHHDSVDHVHPFLLDLSRAIEAIIVISILFHLTKYL